MNYDYYGQYVYGQGIPTGYQPMTTLPVMAQPVQPPMQPSMQPPAQSTDPIFVYPQNLAGALALIQQALAGESEDRQFYSQLIEMAPTQEEKQIISGIRDNEIGHYALFRQLYMELTGTMPVPAPSEPFVPSANYCEGLKKALLGEQNAVQKYRKILYAMQNRVHIVFVNRKV